MNLALWIIAGVLAFAFAGSGIMKLVQSKDKLVASPTGGWAATGVLLRSNWSAWPRSWARSD